MTWQNEMTVIVRYLIDDYDDGSPLYSDSRLENTILVGAQLVLFDLDFDKDYTIDVDSCTLTPDPTADTKDNGFINLVSLKTACIILQGEAKAAATGSFKVKDGGRFGSAEIDTTSRYSALKDRAARACKDYENARTQYQVGSGRVGQAIFGPITNEQTYPIQGNFS